MSSSSAPASPNYPDSPILFSSSPPSPSYSSSSSSSSSRQLLDDCINERTRDIERDATDDWNSRWVHVVLSLDSYNILVNTNLPQLEAEVQRFMDVRSSQQHQHDLQSFVDMMNNAAMVYGATHLEISNEYQELRNFIMNQFTTPIGIANSERIRTLFANAGNFMRHVGVLSAACADFVRLVRIHAELGTRRIVFGPRELDLLLTRVSMLPTFANIRTDFHKSDDDEIDEDDA